MNSTAGKIAHRNFVQGTGLGRMSFSSSSLIFRRNLNFCNARNSSLSALFPPRNTLDRARAHYAIASEGAQCVANFLGALNADEGSRLTSHKPTLDLRTLRGSAPTP